MTTALRWFLVGAVFTTVVWLLWEPNLWIVLAAFLAGHVLGVIVYVVDAALERVLNNDPE